MDQIQYSANLSSENLQKRFKEVQTLLAKAYGVNQQLRSKLNMQQIALEAIAPSVIGATKNAGEFMSDVGFTNADFNGQKLAFHTFWNDGTITNSSGVRTEPDMGTLMLDHIGQDIDRVPRVRETGEASTMVSVSINNSVDLDPYVRWVLDTDKFWANRFNKDKTTMLITLPPTLRSDINYIAIENLFPEGIQHTLKYIDTHSMGVAVSATNESHSKFYPIDGTHFGGQLQLELRSTLKSIDNKFTFGLKNIRIGYRKYATQGYVVNKININHAGGLLNLQSFNAAFSLPKYSAKYGDYLRFEIGKGVDENGNIIDTVYDTIKNTFPFLSTDTAIEAGSIVPDIDGNCHLYVKTYLYGMNNTSPRIDGFYFEYEGA
ncbi:hypothetical protein [Acinetobacter sp.]|uniref:hypothetical protein n=1 Tax=Acinetobacter sp. TaxID=472 RepID=UPI003D08CBE0